MKTRKLMAPILLMAASALMFSAASYAESNHKSHKPQPIKGCYQVARGSIQESPANTDVVGVHNLVLVQHGSGKDLRKRIELSGPLAGREDRNEHPEEGEGEEGEEGEEHEENPAEKHGQHAFGTFDFSGVLLSFESDSGVTGVDCFNEQGIPGLVHGFEVMTFYGGTGAYSGLTEGQVRFEGSFDRCTDPNNPVARFRVASGEICFGE
jgi:hypothetical protein